MPTPFPNTLKSKLGIAVLIAISFFIQPIFANASQDEFEPTVDSLEFVVNAVSSDQPPPQTRFHSPVVLIPPPEEASTYTPAKQKPSKPTITTRKRGSHQQTASTRLTAQEYKQILGEMRARVRARQENALPKLPIKTATPVISPPMTKKASPTPDKYKRSFMPRRLLPIHESVHREGNLAATPKATAKKRKTPSRKRSIKKEVKKAPTHQERPKNRRMTRAETFKPEIITAVEPTALNKAAAPRPANPLFTKLLQRMQMRKTIRQKEASRLGVILPSQGGQFPNQFPNLKKLQSSLRQMMEKPTDISFEYHHNLAD